MGEFSINRTDLEQIENILRNNVNIDRLYTKLYTLEMEDKKETNEYSKLLDYISIVVEVENKLYKEASLTIERALSWINFINQKRINSIDIRQNITNQYYDDRILSRILNNLFKIILKNYNSLVQQSDNNLKNISKLFGMKITKKVDVDTICKLIKIQNIIEKDIIFVFLSFLQTYIDDPKYRILKEKLLAAKYNATFIHKDIEEFSLTHNFNIPIPPYTYSNVVADLLKLDILQYKKIKDLIGSNIINNELYQLLEINNIDYNNITKASSSVLRQCMIRSAFVFMSDEKTSDINFDFHELIQDNEYPYICPDSTISEKLIINCFKNINKDKSKIKTLSIKV